MLWDDKEIAEFQDQALQRDIHEYRQEFYNEWDLIYGTFSNEAYDEFFPGITDPTKKSVLFETFKKAFISVVTRCFGWGVPTTSMIPFADSINHHNVDSTYEMIHLKYHQYPDT